MMSLALWLVTGCVSESMKSVSDRVFQRAAEQFVLMDSNLAEGGIICFFRQKWTAVPKFAKSS